MVSVNLRPGEGRQAAASRRRRPKTVSVRRLNRDRGLPIVDRDDDDDDDGTLPASRSACRAAARPCPWVSCRYHLYLDVSPHGAIKFNFPDLEPWEMPVTCALDVAEAREGMTLDDVGGLLNVTRERSRQIEQTALGKIARALDEDE